MYRPPSSPQEKSENAVNQSKILLRFFLRRGEVCTQATRRSLGLSPIGSTQIFSSSCLCHWLKNKYIPRYEPCVISGLIMGQRSPGNRPTVACSQTPRIYWPLAKGGWCGGKDCLVRRPHDCARSMRFGSLGSSEPFVSDTSPKCIDRRTRQGKRENRL